MAYESGLATVYLFIGVLTTLLGLVILRENPGSRLNRVTALMLFFAGIEALLGAGSLWAGSAPIEASFHRSTLVANFAYLWEFFFPALLVFAATFPREHSWLRHHGWGELVVFLPHTIHFFLMFFATIWGTGFGLETVSGRLPAGGALLDLPRIALEQFYRGHRQLFSLVNLSYIGLSIFWIARNLRRSRNESVARQLRVILFGIGFGLILYSLADPLNLLLGLHLSPVVSSTLLVVALAACAGTIAYAIVRHRFLDARWIVRRTILYAVASALIVGVYLQIVRRLAATMTGFLAVPPGVLDWVALVVPLVFFQPVMGRLEEAMEGWLLRGRRELRAVAAQLSERMSSSLDFSEIADGLVGDLREALTAGGASLILRETAPRADSAYATIAADGVEPEILGLLEIWAPELPDPVAPGRPHSKREWVAAATRTGVEREKADQILRTMGPELTYELRHGSERLGLYLLGPKASGIRYSGEEIALLTNLFNQVGVALKNSLLHLENLEKTVLEEELALARRIQQAFLPSQFPHELPFEVSGLNIPSKQVGGDYFDFFPVDGGGYGFAIADVSGKGVPAALLASMLQASLRTLLQDGIPPHRVTERVNALLCESTTPEQFVTLFVGHLDPDRRTLTYCNAGHNYPVLARMASAGVLLEPSQLILGIDPTTRYAEDQIAFDPGDVLLLYTDGVTEARTPWGEEFGEDRLAAVIDGQRQLAAEPFVREIRDTVLRFTETGELQDDMTLLFIRVPTRQPEDESRKIGTERLSPSRA